MMLRKDTHVEIQHLTEPRLLKVISLEELIEKGTAVCAGDVGFDDLLLWSAAVELQRNPQLLSLPVAGFLIPEQWDGHAGVDRLLIHSPKDPDVVRPGDVIALTPGNSLVRVLYRRGSDSNLLFMTDRATVCA